MNTSTIMCMYTSSVNECKLISYNIFSISQIRLHREEY